MTKTTIKTKQLSRDEVRTRIFTSKGFKSECVELFGADIEIRQPSLGDILEYQENLDRKTGLMLLLTGYCYIPGTNEKVFEAADADGILNMPFGDDIVRLNKAIENLTSIDIAGEEGN